MSCHACLPTLHNTRNVSPSQPGLPGFWTTAVSELRLCCNFCRNLSPAPYAPISTAVLSHSGCVPDVTSWKKTKRTCKSPFSIIKHCPKGVMTRVGNHAWPHVGWQWLCLKKTSHCHFAIGLNEKFNASKSAQWGPDRSFPCGSRSIAWLCRYMLIEKILPLPTLKRAHQKETLI